MENQHLVVWERGGNIRAWTGIEPVPIGLKSPGVQLLSSRIFEWSINHCKNSS